MATSVGDVAGKIALLRRDLFQIRYPSVFDEPAARVGHPQALMPVINFILSRFSRHITAVAAAFTLPSCNDRKYIENVFKLAREQFNMRIVLSSTQFMAEVRTLYIDFFSN
jgi:Centrosomal spindle body, CEP44